MSPRTRQSQAGGSKDHAHAEINEIEVPLQTSSTSKRRSNPNAADINVPLPVCEKRTFSSSDASTSMPSETQAKAAKKSRTDGPAHGRPMSLKIAHESQIVNQQESDGNTIKGKRVQLQRASSYYPGRGDDTHVLSYIKAVNDHFPDPDVDDCAESEEDSDDDQQIVELALQNSSVFSEAVATERPTWKESGGIDMPRPARLSPQQSLSNASGSASSPMPTPMPPVTPAKLPAGALSLYEAPAGDATPELPIPVFRVDTDLVIIDGKLALNSQRPLICAIVHEAFDHLRASLLFRDAFPNGAAALSFAREALIAAAEDHKTGGLVKRRLEADDEYAVRLSSLPRARIPIFRSNVKERCNAVSAGALLAMGSPANISEAVKKQLSIYTYTFPLAPGSMGARGIAKRTQPYRNERIIKVIRDLYFTASNGSVSVASRFGDLFPTYQGDDGVESREVPVAMVSLVATGLYAALHEWRTGERQTQEFSTNTYIDVYQGHVETFRYILGNRERAFHAMMSYIYTQASTPNEKLLSTSVPIAELDLDMLEE